MITEIKIAKCASYPDAVQEMKPLACNYVFGFNGTGKSTLARLIQDPAHSDFDCSSIKWADNTPLEVRVYNRDFIKAELEADDMRGVFTLGKGAKDAKLKIAEKREAEKVLAAEITTHEETLGQLKKDLSLLEDTTERACWDSVNPRKSPLKGAFMGHMAGTAQFFAEVLRHRGSKADERDAQYLIEQAKFVFDSMAQPMTPLPTVDTTNLLGFESEPLLSTKIIAGGDVPISRLIEKMNNSDWLRQGQRYLDSSEGKCPYCQQDLPPNLAQQMEVIFNAEFTRLSEEYDEFVGKYERGVQDFRDSVEAVLLQENPYLDTSAFNTRVAAVEVILTDNFTKLGEKQRELSRVIELDTVKSLAEEIAAILATANQKVADYNAKVADQANQKRILTAQVWKHLADKDLKPLLDKYLADKKAKGEAIRTAEQSIKDAGAKKDTIADEIKELQEQVTDVHKVLNDINGLLKSFGFSGFSLKATRDGKGYRIVRPDGTLARESLSEGERSFVSFLYFYHLISGSHDSDAAVSNRVVVFDDPVSSMDSEVLFIVSTLIRDVLDMTKDSNSHVKQVFVLTHNVYFHHEVSYLRKTKTRDVYWMVRKPDEVTEIKCCGWVNPVKSSYQLLWDEIGVREPSPATVQNNVRRILEHYFQFNGSSEIKDVAKSFPEDDPDKKIVLAMVSWLHSGSHTIADDVSYSLIDQETVAKYLKVFKRVFEVTGHPKHYEMMCSGQMQEDLEQAATMVVAGEGAVA